MGVVLELLVILLASGVPANISLLIITMKKVNYSIVGLKNLKI